MLSFAYIGGDYTMYIISVIISSISIFLGFLNLFIKPDSNILVGLTLMLILLLFLLKPEYEYFCKNKNNIKFKLFYYIHCFILIIFSLFTIQNLQFS